MTGTTTYFAECFIECFPDKETPRVLYGLGKNTKELLPHIRDYNIRGLMDGRQKKGSFAGIPIIDGDGMAASGVREIILMAQPLSQGIIYRRIKDFCRQHEIRIMDLEGKNLSKIFRQDGAEHPYYRLGWEALREVCEAVDVVTFDIFDTLVMRDVLYPEDIFEIMEHEMTDDAGWPRIDGGFARLRGRAEKRLFSQGPYPNLYQIYDIMKQEAGFDHETKERLMALELETELAHIFPRQTMMDFFHEIRRHKDVYLISDMYLTREMIEQILQRCGCEGFKDVLVSSTYGVGKRDGLFELFKEKVGTGRRTLHIGDSYRADDQGARMAGLDSFRIMSGAEMLVFSDHGHMIKDDMTMEQRMEAGALISRKLNDPFVLQGKKGKLG